MSETRTFCKSSINDPDAEATEFQLRLDTYSPDSSETPTPVEKLVERKPVSWDGPHDPKNPHNWSASRKWLVMSVNAVITVNVYVPRVTFVELTS